ncbi:MAG: hypothetical protein IKO43_06775, partial [Kiritimatiellae bacterium]|nr:hypothetical protein [Kiritimatiellia bacterium]
TGDLTAANVTAYKPGGTTIESDVTKTFNTDAGTLTIALQQIAIAADAGYVDFSTLTVPESGTVAITTDHPVTLALSASDVTSLSTRTDKINLVASGTGSFRLLLPDSSPTPQNVLDTLPFAGDFEIMYDLATFDATALATAIAVPADAKVAFTNSSDSVVEYTGALSVGAGAAVNTYANMTLSNAANAFGSGASLGVFLGSAEVAFASASAPSAITVAESAVLALSNTAITGNIAFSGTGTLRLLGDLAVAGNVTFSSAATLAFADGASLTATGDGTESGCVLANAAVTLAPDSQTAASGALLSAEAITAVPPFATTAPSDGNTYAFESTSTAVTFTRTPNAAFSYDVAIGAVASSGWVASWGGATTMQSLRIGPNAAYSVVPEIVKNAFEPWYDLPARTGSFSFSVWADVSKMLEVTDGGADGKRMMLSVGDQAAAAILYREGDYVKFANVVGGTPLGIAQLAVPSDSEFHLYTAVCDFDNKTMSLYIDGGAGGQSATGETLSAVTLNSGIQVGSVFCHDDQALPGSFWCGTKMALAAVRGYNKAISAAEVANIASNFPVGGSSFARSVTISQNDTTAFTGYNNTMPVGYTLELRRGVFNIPAGYEFSVPILRTLNISISGVTPTMSATIDGTLRISGSSGKDPWSSRENTNPGGIVLGEWTGTGEYTVSSTGSIIADDAYLMTVKSAGTQTINVNGGTIDVKGLWADKAGSSITVKDNGTLCVKEIPTDGGAITKNLKWATFRIKADATETRAINFSAASGYATTLDPNGHTLTLAAAAVTGAGDITVGTSANPKGKVVFQGNGNYTGSLIVNSANMDMIEFSPVNAWTGNVKYTVGGAIGQNFNGYAGTLTIDGAITVDARGIDLSAATVILSNGATLIADAGKEAKTGGITVNTGTTLKLYVSDDVYNYEGHVFIGSPAGTLEYWRVENETDVQITDTNVLVGNNLLPYYQTWEVESGTGSGVVNLATNWKGGEVPTERTDGTYGNAAFHVTDGSEITVTVDATIPFGEIQVYGEGTVTFAASGENYLSADVVSISSGVTVKLAGGEPLKVNAGGFVQGGTKLAVASGASLSLDSVSCSTKLQVDGALTTRGVCDLATGVWNIFNAGSMFTVASGTNTVMTEEKAFKGAIVVSAGATLVNARNSDAIDYDATVENPVTVEVYGILSMGTTCWSLGSNNTIILHEGAQVTGTGDATNGALDWIENAVSTLVADGNASIASKLRVRGGANVTFDITDGKALTHTGGWTGDGMATIPNGQLISTAVPTCTASISSGATFTLKDCAWTSTSGDVFSGEGTLELQTAGTTRNMEVASTFGGTLKVTKNGSGWSVFTATAPQFANRPKLIVGGSSAGMVLDTDFAGGESKAFTVKNLEGSGTISSKNGATGGNRFIDALQTENTVFSGNFEAGGQGNGGTSNRNSALIVRGPDVLDGEVKWLKLTGASSSAGDLLVKSNAKVIFEGSGSWASGTVTVEDGGWLDLTAKQDAVATLVLNAGGSLKVDTAAIPTVATLALPASGVVNIDTAATPWVYRPPFHKTQWRGMLRAVLIGPRARKILEKYRDGDFDGYPFT